MADDKGGGGSGGLGGWAFNVVGAAKDAVGDIVTELESFTKFQQRVDQLIKDLQESQAGPKRVGQEALERTKFGGGHSGWYEAHDVFSKYDTVIADLENLSKLLSDSIEAMGIAVMASHKGYENVDVDVRRRMAAISAETTDHYGGEYVPHGPRHKAGDAAGKARGDGGEETSL
ncbi:hypothetical protein OKJ48_36425 [Streptomyces kunmingensis]|uniref:WXG100 family type VII secretion target n=1 Tax=Streptomyces kunmingensis TaxID=68225 RepID=A0ABU6CLR8_9ACTN|nr:hypothetical protein [Streptomyces kunmingensis]MEB3965669.1 hypothetical protein [Streptomyces kunmingensis]